MSSSLDEWTEPSPQCRDHLMEPGWEEGFDCSLPPGHDGPHRDMTDWNERNESKSSDGRAYIWAYEWQYCDVSIPQK